MHGNNNTLMVGINTLPQKLYTQAMHLCAVHGAGKK